MPQDLGALVRAAEEQERRRATGQASNTLYAARGQSPEAAAMARRSAAVLGVPPVLVDSAAHDEARALQDQRHLTEAERTAGWLAKPDNAAVAHDQVESLSFLERTARQLSLFSNPATQGLAVHQLARDAAGGLGEGLGLSIRGIGRAGARVFDNTPLESDFEAINRIGRRVQIGGRNVRGTLTAVERALYAPDERPMRDRFVDTGFAGEVASGVGQVAGQVMVHVGTGGTLTLPSLFGQGVGQMEDRVDQARAREGRTGGEYTLGDDIALLGGGIVTGLSEKLGLDAVLGALPKPIRDRLTAKWMDIAVAGLTEGGSEVVEGVGQNALARFALGEDTGLLDGTVEGGSVGTVVGSVARAMLMTAIPGRQHLAEQHRAEVATQAAETFAGLKEAVANNPLLKLSPEAMQDYLGETMGDQTVYLPAGAAATFFQDNADLDPWLDEWDLRDQYDQALATGADIAIPLPVYLAKINGTKADEAWANEVRFGVDGMSAKEAADFEANAEASLTEAFDAADQAETEAAPAMEAEKAVEQSIFSQLREAGYTIDAARTNAIIEARRFARRAERSPHKFPDAMAAYADAGLTVRAEFPESLRPAVGSTDGRLMTLYTALKAGRRPAAARRMFGRSLAEFVSSEGGMHDTGGELAAMGADQWHKGKGFRRKLIRADATGNYGSDYVAERAIEAGYLPEGSTGNDLLEKLREEVAGRPVYSADFERDIGMEENRAALDDLERVLGDVGIDARTATYEEVRAAVERLTADAPLPAGPDLTTDAGLDAFWDKLNEERFALEDAAGSNAIRGDTLYDALVEATTPTGIFGTSNGKSRAAKGLRHALEAGRMDIVRLIVARALRSIKRARKEFGGADANAMMASSLAADEDIFREILDELPSDDADLGDGWRLKGGEALERLTANDDAAMYDQGRLDVDSEAFGRWFGDSKAVDENGAPLVVYHGTNQTFDAFSTDRLGAATASASARLAFAFSDSQSVSSLYAQHAAETVIADEAAHNERVADLQGQIDAAERRRDWSEQERLIEALEDLDIGAMRAEPAGQNVLSVYLSIQNPVRADAGGGALPRGWADMIEQAKADGHDGMILTNVRDDPTGGGGEVSTHYFAFSPTQIKSTANRGTWDANDPRILYQSAEPATDDFRSWFGESVATDEAGEPLLLYRGQHGAEEGLQSRLPSLTFSTQEAATLYANEPNNRADTVIAPRVFSAYVSIQKPLTNETDGDPYLDLQVLIDAIGFDEAAQVARDNASLIEQTGAWEDDFSADFEDVADVIARAPERLGALPVLAFEVLDSPRVVDLLKAAGFDGAVHGGTGQAFESTEYRVFSPDQVRVVAVDGQAEQGQVGGEFTASSSLNAPRPGEPTTGSPSREEIGTGRLLYQTEPAAPPFYSALARAVADSKTTKAPAAQWKATLAKTPGVKADELFWVGVNDWLDMQEGPVTREALEAFVAGNGVRVEEVVLGGIGVTDDEVEALSESAEDWEFLSSRDRDERRDEARSMLEAERGVGETQFSDWKLPGADDTYREVLLTLPNLNGPSTHWDTENVVAHARLTERTDADGQRVLFIEEIQSDWHQKGRDEGYRQPLDEAAVDAARAAVSEARENLTATAQTYRAALLPRLEGATKVALRAMVGDRQMSDSFMASLDDVGTQAEARLLQADMNVRDWLELIERDKAQAKIDGSVWSKEVVEARDAYVTAQLRFTEADRAESRALSPSGIPDAPFRTSWPALVMKRMIRYAVDIGADKIAWTTGEQQADRYDLAEQTGPIWSERRGEDVLVRMKGPAENAILNAGKGKPYTGGGGGLWMTRAELTEVLGNELGGRVYDGATEEGQSIPAEDVKVGGEGMRAFYDRNLVNITNDIVKRFGGKVGRVRLADPAHSEVGVYQKYSPDGSGRWWMSGPSGPVEGVDFATRAEAQAALDVAVDNDPSRQQPGFTITPELRAQAERGFTLFQRQNGGPRGSIRLGQGRAEISLFASRNLSTFTHETGHLWLDLLMKDAADPAASEELKADARRILAWFNVNDASEITEEHHEMFARGWERYLMEGRAPSGDLRSVFRQMAGWLKSIYRSVLALNAPLTDEVRDVMDRLLASDDEIAAAREVSGIEQGFADAAQAGMTGEAFDAYTSAVQRARGDAEDQLLRRVMKAIRRERTAEWNAAADEIRASVEAEVDAMPDIAAVNWITRTKTPLNREIVVRMLGDEAGLALLPKRVPPLVSANGAHPDTVAEVAGYPSGMTLLEGLMDQQTEKAAMMEKGDNRSVRAARVDAAIQTQLREQMGDPLTDGSIEAEALAAVHAGRQAEVLGMELAALARRVDKTPSPVSIMREWAAARIGSRPVIETKPGRYLRAERAAANATQKALAAGNREEAFRQKQAQTINHLLYSESRKAEQFVDAAIARLRKLGKKKTVASMDQDYLDRIHDLLRRFDLTDIPQVQVRARLTLLQFVAEKEAAGDPINIPEKLLNTAKLQHYSTLTVDEMRELNETVQHLAALGRLKKDLIVAGERRDFERAVAEAVDSAAPLKDKPYREAIGKAEGFSAVGAWLHGSEASLVKIQATLRRLDGNVRGIWTKMLDEGGQAASDRLYRLREQFWAGIIAAQKAIPSSVKARWTDKLEVHPIINPRTGQKMTGLLRRDLLGMARHVGTLSNFEKMAKGWGIIPNEADEFAVANARTNFIAWLTTELDASEWDYVQAWWDAHEAQRETYFENERDLTGIRPVAVEAAPVGLPGRTLAGGYAPISYDPAFDAGAAKRQAEDADDVFGGFTRKPRTSNGAAQDRTGYTGPVNLSMDRAAADAQTQMVRIAYGRYIHDALKFIHNPLIRETIRLKAGDDAFEQIQLWLGAQVKDGAPENPATGAMDKFLRASRTNFSAAVLLGSATVLIAQPAGLMASAAVVGPARLAKGVANAMRLTVRGEYASFIFGRSTYMEQRVNEGGFDRDVRASLLKNPGAEGVRERMILWSAAAVGWVDFLFVSGPTWLAAYDQAGVDGATEAEAARAADAVVQRTQGGSRPIDQAGVQRGSEIAKTLTFAFGWANAHYNLQRDYALDVRDGRERFKAATGLFFLIVAAPLIDAMLSGDWPKPEDDEDELEAWGNWLVRNVLFGIPVGVPVIRDLANVAEREAQGKYGGEPWESPLARVGKPFLQVGKDIEAAFDPEKEASKRWPAHVLTALGFSFGIPGTIQATRAVNYLQDVEVGEQEPDSVGDWINGLLRGPQQDQR